MYVKDIVTLLDGQIVSNVEDIETRQVSSGFGADMMSDVLAFVKDQPLLLTGLCNAQVIRTAEMMDIMCVVFVRGKEPDERMIMMAEDRDICLITTTHTLFTACGILYNSGLVGGC